MAYVPRPEHEELLRSSRVLTFGRRKIGKTTLAGGETGLEVWNSRKLTQAVVHASQHQNFCSSAFLSSW